MDHNLTRAKKISELFDTKFNGPFGIKFGLDAIIGLVPIIGDIITTFVSFYIVYLAAHSRCSIWIICRMALNIAIENAIGVIPFIGNLFDFIWRANVKNVKLFEQSVRSPRQATFHSQLVLISVLVIILTFLLSIFALGFYLAYVILSLLSFAP